MQSDQAGNQGSKYRPYILQALSRFGYPLPVELMEAIISIESGGVPGLVNPKSGATGLGQVMPVVVRDYNKATGEQITMQDLRGQDQQSISDQISISVWVAGRFWRSAYNYLVRRRDTVPIDELTKIADLFYVAGPGATKKKLEKVSVPTFEQLEKAFPKWNAFRHVHRLLKRIPENTQWQLASISEWLHGPGIVNKLQRDPKLAGLIGVFALLAGSYLFFRR